MVEKCCLYCGGPIPNRRHLGRPKVWCSVRCRRLAEYEVRRLNRRLEHLENEAAAARAYSRTWERKRIAFLEKQITECTTRLGRLIT